MTEKQHDFVESGALYSRELQQTTISREREKLLLTRNITFVKFYATIEQQNETNPLIGTDQHAHVPYTNIYQHSHINAGQ